MATTRAVPRHSAIIRAIVAIATLLAAACGRDSITGPAQGRPTSSSQLIAFKCDASPVNRSVICGPAEHGLNSVGPSDSYGRRLQYLLPSGGASVEDNIIIGGQNTYVKLTSSAVAIVADTFAFNVTIQNLIPQAIGTVDGTVSDSSLSVFFNSGPTTTAGSGSVTVANASGVNTFTAPNQLYYRYGDFLPKNAISQSKRWKFRFDPTVENFSFLLYVSANVKYPDGYIDIYNPVDSVAVAGSKQLGDSVRNAIGVVNPNVGPVTWSSADTTIATINSSTGSVTGVRPGNVTVTATTGPQSGTAMIVVLGVPPSAVVDSAASSSVPGDAYHVAFNTTFSLTAPGVMSNDNRGNPQATVTSFGGDSVGGTVTTNAAGSTVTPLPGHADGSLSVASDGAVTFTPSTGFTGYYAFHYRISNVVNGTPQTSDALVKIAVGTRPTASASTYAPTLLGNVRINTDTVGGTGAKVTAAGDAPIYAVTGSTGGTANVHSNKGYDFTPNVGFSGAASFTFTVKNGFGTSAPATVSLTVGTTPVWFVNATAPSGGDGRSNAPFTCLVGASGCFNGSANAAGAIIYVATGPYTDNATLTLKNTQRLIGQGATGTFSTLSGLTWPADAGAQPGTGGTSPIVSLASGTTITLGSGNTVRGLRISSAAGSGILGTSVGTLDVANVAINSTGGPAIDWTSGTATATVDSMKSTNSSSTGINLSSLAGTVTINGATSSITGPTGSAVSINGSNPTFSYAGTISKTNGAGVGISLASMTGGSATFTGPSVVLSTGSSNGINMTSSASVVSFVDSVKVTTTTGNGVNATSGGTLSIAGTHNSITSVGGIALNVSSTTIGAAGLNFRSISANGGSNGIVLSSTGTFGGLTITGDGSTNGSGGSIVNTTGSDGAVAGNGVYLSSTRNINISWAALSGHTNHGIFGTGVRGLNLNHVRFTGTNGSSGSGAFLEGAVHLVDAGGGLTIKNSRLDGAAYDAFVLSNNVGTSPVVDSLVLASDTVSTMQGSTADVRGSALQAIVADGSVNARIRNNSITYWWGNGIQVAVQTGASPSTALIQNNIVHQTSGALAAAGGIEVSGGNLSFNISGNSIRGTDGTAISADRAQGNTFFNGTIDGNTIGASGVANSGSATGTGIFVQHAGVNATTVKISNNTIRQINGSQAIWALLGDDTGGGGAGSLNVTIVGNNIAEEGSAPSARTGIVVQSGRVTGDTDTMCADVGGAGALANSITNFNTRIRPNQRFNTIMRMPGYTGTSGDATAVNAYIQGRNPGTVAVTSTSTAGGGGIFNTVPAGSACAQPTM
jgi:hypothetical protein